MISIIVEASWSSMVRLPSASSLPKRVPDIVMRAGLAGAVAPPGCARAQTLEMVGEGLRYMISPSPRGSRPRYEYRESTSTENPAQRSWRLTGVGDQRSGLGVDERLRIVDR